jgi:hypothetical protein
MLLEDSTTAATRLVRQPVRLRPDDDTTSPCVLAPSVHASKKGFVLGSGESARELNADLLEELSRADVGKPFQSPRDDRPDHAHRM